MIAIAMIMLVIISVTATSIFFPKISTVTTTETVYTSGSTTSTTEIYTTPDTALVFGLVGATGHGTNLTEFIFKSVVSGAVFTVPIANSRSFSVRLPNPDNFNVTAVWIGAYYWQRGEIYIGNCITNWGPQSTDAQSFNQVVDTPNSIINVSGIVQPKINTVPLSVKFAATNGLIFEQQHIMINGSYNGQLANMMNYSVSVKLLYTNGTTEYCNAGLVDLNEGPGIANSSLHLLSC